MRLLVFFKATFLKAAIYRPIMVKKPIPTENEVMAWLLSTLQHACHMEYFLGLFNLGKRDPERPHDLVGPGNKYEWEVVKGLALQYRNPEPDFQTYILPSLKLHRQQYHHQKWNEPDPTDKTKTRLIASADDLLVGAIDAVCSLLENRAYQGGPHNYDEVTGIVKQKEIAKDNSKNTPHKSVWMLKVIPEMRRLIQPDLKSIVTLIGFPNIGLKPRVYDSIAQRTTEAVELLRNEHRYLLE